MQLKMYTHFNNIKMFNIIDYICKKIKNFPEYVSVGVCVCVSQRP